MTKIPSIIFLVLSCVHVMNAVPTGFLLPALSQITETVRTASGNIMGKLNETMQANRETSRAAIDQAITAATTVVGAISDNRTIIREGVAAEVIEIQKSLVEIAEILQTSLIQTGSVVQQNARTIASATAKAAGDVLWNIRSLADNVRKESADAIQIVIDAEVHAANRLVVGARDLLRERINGTDFGKIQSGVAVALLGAVSKVVDVAASVVDGRVRFAIDLVEYAQRVVDSVAQRQADSWVVVKSNLQILKDYLQQISTTGAGRGNAVAEDIARRANELVNDTIISLDKYYNN